MTEPFTDARLARLNAASEALHEAWRAVANSPPSPSHWQVLRRIEALEDEANAAWWQRWRGLYPEGAGAALRSLDEEVSA